MNTSQEETVVLGGGCFWCTEAVLSALRGVISVTPGYSGGAKANPTYEEVCTGKTGHAEVARIIFDPTIISYKDLLDIYWHTHDPTTLNKQGADVGTQYRSVIFTSSEEQKNIAEALKKEINASGEFHSPIVTEIKPLDVFYEAESYHKEYYTKNSYQPYCQVVISPKISHLKQKYAKKLKEIVYPND
jgi:peptide-methionine (S)-S-oxide reductase